QSQIAARAPIQVICRCGQHQALGASRYASGVGDVFLFPFARVPPVLRCSADPKAPNAEAVNQFGATVGVTAYAANLQALGNHQYNSGPVSLANGFPDGTAQTILYAERYGSCGGVTAAWLRDTPDPSAPVFAYNGPDPGTVDVRLPQIAPPAADCDPRATQSPHSGCALVGMADGSVRLVGAGVTLEAWRSAVLPAGGGTVGLD